MESSLYSAQGSSWRRFVARLFGQPVVWLLVLLLTCSSCVTPSAPRLRRFEFTQPQMGLPFRIVLYAVDGSVAESAAAAAFQRIAQLNGSMSDYEPESELSQLSRTAGTGQAVPVSPDLWNVLERAQELARLSGGAFDVTVGPVVGLWRKARRERKFPNTEQLTAARAAVGYEKLQLDPHRRTAKLLAPGMRLDLGAIAKGYAVDQALGVLEKRGVTRALVAGGGDMALGAPPPGAKGWRIEIAPLDVTNAPPARFVTLSHMGLATSGDVFQNVEIGGKRYSHIVDPRTGIGLTDHSLVTVIAPDGITADGLATAVSVLGPTAGLKLIAKMKGAKAHVVRKPGSEIEFMESPGFRRFYL